MLILERIDGLEDSIITASQSIQNFTVFLTLWDISCILPIAARIRDYMCKVFFIIFLSLPAFSLALWISSLLKFVAF